MRANDITMQSMLRYVNLAEMFMSSFLSHYKSEAI